ncbi:alpha-amylase-like [Mya arenaria]|uniref:alpha-amylase-like n=1 Tax=Mya arenaria TaxID=6604 RepID=UPI0022E02D0A|nr:alpha-amylase-like [Mya arenaria]
MNTLLAFCALLGAALGDYTDPHCGGKQVIVHLFEWKWTDVALECERFLSQKGFCGVQVSPANEHVMVSSPPRPWWERYQPVSYKLHSRSGTEAEFANMVSRCKAVGVRIYVDIVINHMAGKGRQGTGTGGSSFNADNFDFPGVPFVREHFNPYCRLTNYGDPTEVRNCYLVDLTDLNQGNEYVRNSIAGFLNTMIDLGVAGFRVDAAKHMWPRDIQGIQGKLKDLPEGGRPFFYQEVIDQGGEPIKTSEYTGSGYVTEFRFGIKMREGIQDFGRLGQVVDYGWGMTDSAHAFVFIDNHDNQRGHGGGGDQLTYKKPHEYKLAVAFMLAFDYGFTRVMSSYSFSSSDQGPPHNGDNSIKDVTVNADGKGCGNGWVCEHRWSSIANMVAFRNAVAGTTKGHWFDQNDEVAFSRGNKGFFAMAKSGHMDRTLDTGLPAGQYCDLITNCAKKITVDSSGKAHISINSVDEPVVAFIVGGARSETPAGTSGGGSSNSQTTTAASGSAPTAPGGWSRTVIMVEKQTNPGQDLFIRGGLDHSRNTGCSQNAKTSACAIPIRERSLGTSAHYTKYNAWSNGDNFLDWYGAEAGQGTYHGQVAEGTPAVWTTNVAGQAGHSDLNTYGQHYWLVDVDMDCSRTDGGWFEIKAVVNGQWEGNIPTPSTCSGSGAGSPPATTSNHWARCGMLNVYHFGSGTCEIKTL